MLIEEDEEEEQDKEHDGGEQSSFQSCTSSPPLAQDHPNEEMDSLLTEVGRLDGDSLANRVNTGVMVGTESGLQSRVEKGNNTPSLKCPLVTGLGLSYVVLVNSPKKMCRMPLADCIWK